MTNFFMKKLNKKGFTLAELLIVVAILAILIAVAIPIYTGVMQDAQQKVNQSNERALKGAATTYILSHWTEPDSNSKNYSTGADEVPKTGGGSDPAPGWYAWAWFGSDGKMGTVHVAVGKATAVGVQSSTAAAEPATLACPTSDLTAVSSSGSVTNPNVIVVQLTGTDIGK